jgi:hypothetical protein
MQKQSEQIVTACEQAFEATRLDNAKGAALHQAQVKLTAAISNTAALDKETRTRLTNLHTSASGFLSSLERHGACGALQGGLTALRRRAESV